MATQWISVDSPFALTYIGAASFTIYSRTKENFAQNNILYKNTLVDVALTGGISGAMSGALISFGSARKYPSLHLPRPSFCMLRFPVERSNWSRCVPANFFLYQAPQPSTHTRRLSGICDIGAETAGVLDCCCQGCFVGQSTRNDGCGPGDIQGERVEGSLYWVPAPFL